MPTDCKVQYGGKGGYVDVASSKITIHSSGDITLTHSGYPHIVEHNLRAVCGGTNSAIIKVGAQACSLTEGKVQSVSHPTSGNIVIAGKDIYTGITSGCTMPADCAVEMSTNNGVAYTGVDSSHV